MLEVKKSEKLNKGRIERKQFVILSSHKLLPYQLKYFHNFMITFFILFLFLNFEIKNHKKIKRQGVQIQRRTQME